MIKLKNIVESQSVSALTSDEPRKLSKDEKKALAELISSYNEYGKILHQYEGVVSVADTLKKISELAEVYAINECGDWMEANTAKRHFSEIKKHAESFKKLAKDVHEKNAHMVSLYEDMGMTLEKYFEIKDPDKQ